MTPFLWLVAAIAIERLVELVVSTRHARWAFANGGVESGRGHYPWMVLIHVGLLVGCVLETTVGGAEPVAWLAVPMLVLVVAAQVLRWWCITTLGVRWTTRVIVVPGMPLVRTGPYRWSQQRWFGQRWFRHPNYVAVVIEGFALPLVASAWITAIAFTAANAAVLAVRIRAENAALAGADPAEAHPAAPTTAPTTAPTE